MGECTYISSRACLESMYYVYPEFCAARSFRREGRYFAGLQFSTPGVMHDDMDTRRNHIRINETVQFVQAFCRCPDILGIRVLGSAFRSVLCLTPVFYGTARFVSLDPYRFLRC